MFKGLFGVRKRYNIKRSYDAHLDWLKVRLTEDGYTIVSLKLPQHPEIILKKVKTKFTNTELVVKGVNKSAIE